MAEKTQGSVLNGLHTDVDRFLPGYFLCRDQGERTNNSLFSPVLLLPCILLFFWTGLVVWSTGHPADGDGVEHYLRGTVMADDSVSVKSGPNQIPTKKSILSDRQLQFKEK